LFFNKRNLAFIISLSVGLVSFLGSYFFCALSLVGDIKGALFIVFGTFWVCLPLLDLFIFKELENIKTLLERIKKEDYTITLEKQKHIQGARNPLNSIKKEIFDFAEKKQAEINELKKLETFRREFIADISHELKTPVFAAQGFVHTLLDGAIDDLTVRDRFLQKATNSLDALNILVEDLITISQLEIGEIKMDYSRFDLRRSCEIVFEQLEEVAARKKVRLRIYRYSPKSCYVYADKHRIAQVLSNLIMNAIKYGRENGLIMVSFTRESSDVKVAVKDNGFGIPPVHLKRIFERFYRIDKSRSRDFGGTGLGLSIVKHILEAHNSKIGVESKVGEGSTFYFKLKLGKVINEKN